MNFHVSGTCICSSMPDIHQRMKRIFSETTGSLRVPNHSLKRTAGRYTLTVENLTRGSTTALTIRHPEFLDGDANLHVGLFGANTQSSVRKTLIVKEFQATVWTVSPGPPRKHE